MIFREWGETTGGQHPRRPENARNTRCIHYIICGTRAFRATEIIIHYYIILLSCRTDMMTIMRTATRVKFETVRICMKIPTTKAYIIHVVRLGIFFFHSRMYEYIICTYIYSIFRPIAISFFFFVRQSHMSYRNNTAQWSDGGALFLFKSVQ